MSDSKWPKGGKAITLKLQVWSGSAGREREVEARSYGSWAVHRDLFEDSFRVSYCGLGPHVGTCVPWHFSDGEDAALFARKANRWLRLAGGKPAKMRPWWRRWRDARMAEREALGWPMDAAR